VAAEQLKVHYIDVGQGDSILIQAPENNDMLIDGGPRGTGDEVISYLKGQGVEDLEYLVSTHPHTDHIGGLLTVLDNIEVKKVIASGKVHTSKTYEKYLTKIDHKNISFDVGRKGDQFNIGEVEFTILHPDNTEYDLNNSSVVILMQYKKTKFLFTGDIEIEVENKILEGNVNINSHFLKVGHHGSKTSTSKEFIEEVTPKVVVISAGEDNRYGHPHSSALERLDQFEVDIYSTVRNGNIVITTDGESYNIKTEYNSKIKVSEEKSEYNQKDPPENNNNDNGKGKFVGSINSDKYHRSGCRWAENIEPENEIWFDTAEEAQKAGYKPCGTCSPPS